MGRTNGTRTDRRTGFQQQCRSASSRKVKMHMTHDNSDTESYWLRDAKIALLHRDPVDAVNDAEALVQYARKRLDALLKPDSV